MNPFSSVVKTWLKSIGVVASLLCLFMIIAPQASASAWEWISNPWATSCCSSGGSATFTWRTNVSSPLSEYASLYYFVAPTSTDPGTIGNNTNWSEWTSCRRSGTITTGYRQEKCSITAPVVGTTMYLFVRETTNYAGCGTWTPTPDVANCGDAYTTFYTLTP